MKNLGKRNHISVNVTTNNKTLSDTGRFCHASNHIFSENQESMWTNNAKSKNYYEMKEGKRNNTFYKKTENIIERI